MTDRRITDPRPSGGESREPRTVPKLTQKRFKPNTHTRAHKHDLSPSLGTSGRYHKDLETPKRKSRSRFFGGSNGDSPSETETQQDIIWDPASPPSVRNGKGAGEAFRIVDISDIVNRIAPHTEKPVDKDSVLQWIGDTAIPCTPEIEQPRVRRCSVRRQSSNVEDLMKLAKQFDLNMTRQDQERNLARRQDEERCNDDVLNNHLDSGSNGSLSGVHAIEPKVLSHEEELRALFDGPTQNLSGRLSPPSANCSQETTSEAVAPVGGLKRQALTDSVQRSKPDIDDDWESDALLDDLFVLEATQNPDVLSSVSAKTSGQMKAASAKCGSTTMTRSFGLSWIKTASVGQYTKISSKICTKPSPVQTGTIEQLLKPSPHSSIKAQVVKRADSGTEDDKAESPGGRGPRGLAEKSVSDIKNLDPESGWGDGDDDDDLLYQVCDDVERISASQEQQTENVNRPPSDTSSSSSNISRNGTRHPNNSTTKKPAHVFARSHSIPGASSAAAGKLQLSEVNHDTSPVSVLPPRGTKHPSQTQKSSTSHQSTFKRHQSDPMPISNKVLARAPTAVKCTAAEIEKKKQEAIARRRLRLQGTQKPAAPT